jgi:hypothetical protein
MGIAIHEQNQSVSVAGKKFTVGTETFRGENAYKKGGKILITTLGAFGVQQETLTISGVITAGAEVKVTLVSILLGGNTADEGHFAQIGQSVGDVHASLLLQCQENPDMSAHYNITGASPDIIFTAKKLAAPDAVLKAGFNADVSGMDNSISVDTTAAATINVTPTIEGLDPFTGATYPLLVGTTMTTATTQILTIHPDATPAANVAAAENIPRYFKVTMTKVGADLLAYQITLNSND